MSLTQRQLKIRMERARRQQVLENMPTSWFLSKEFSFDNCRCCHDAISTSHPRYKLKGVVLKQLKALGRLDVRGTGKLCVMCYGEWLTMPDKSIRELPNYYNGNRDL